MLLALALLLVPASAVAPQATPRIGRVQRLDRFGAH
jgi:hypothetical protein